MAKDSSSGGDRYSEAPAGIGSSPGEAERRWNGRIDLGLLAAICLLFLAFRLPLMVRQPGGTDEGDFSVPGCTILREGIPRIPYVPSRDAKGYFYRADEALLLLPPLYFYWQAAFYSVLPPSYGTARLASGAAAILAVLLIYALGRQLTRSRTAALWAAGLYSLSRVCFFPAIAARPDMLCGALGLAAVAAFLRWRDGGRPAWLVAAAAFIGLGGLTHPFAILYAVQIGVWTVLIPGPLHRRFRNLLVLVAGATAVFSLWLFLIVPHFEAFRIQFFNNVLNRSGPGLVARLASPWEAIRWQGRLIVEHAQPIQAALMFGALAMTTAAALRSRDRNLQALAALAWSSIVMLVLFAGVHPSKGYWCYPGAWLFLSAGWSVASIGRRFRRFCSRREISAPVERIAIAAGSVGLLLLMLPGSGIRTYVTYLRHWNDPRYDARRFVKVLLDDVPREARVVVDTAYVLPFYLDGRSVLLAGSELVAPDEYLPYDYYVAGRESIATGFRQELGGQLVRTYGERENILACYAELYTPGETAGPRAVGGSRPPTGKTGPLP